MAGLYVHIPFCREACHYCDFHFSIYLDQLTPMLNAIQKEISLRNDYLEGEVLDTIYLGGGTPSILSARQLEKLLKTIREHYDTGMYPEITLEGNPDDLEPGYLADLKNLGVNRISVGIQSFHEGDLRFMNRSHGRYQAQNCMEMARKAGFENLNIDLIYGMPGLTMQKWEKNLDIATSYLPEHIAAYHLTYEKGTVLDYWRRKKRFKVLDENISHDQYKLLIEKLKQKGYLHYEISNFALPGYISRHNTAYWSGKKYLGAGPSAHSFNGKTRRWNISKNTSYINFIHNGIVYYEMEEPDMTSRFHEYLLTSLRTMWGTDMERVLMEFGHSFKEHCLQQAKPFLRSGRMVRDGHKLILTEEGMLIADHIIIGMFLQK
jgi:putative oxygen-independent coproporphyrinogen III oxidase